MVVVFISSKKEKRPSSFDIAIPPTKENGLKGSSIIRCGKIATLEKKIALGELGFLEKENLKKVVKTINKILET